MPDAPLLRRQLADRLCRENVIRDPLVESAMRAVPRHLFAPEVPLEEAYANAVIRLKEVDGTIVSTLSQPAMIVEMLQQLCVREGDRILEIGTGSGYTTALLAELAGESGSVVSIDLERDLVEAAAVRFELLGMRNVRTLTGDGAQGYAPSAPFDRILLTACASDIEAAWWEQLDARGRIVLPLSFNGVQKSIAFHREGGKLLSETMIDCAFISMRGANESDLPARHDAALDAAKTQPVWHLLPGRFSERDPIDSLMLWTALNDSRFCMLHRPSDEIPLYGLCQGETAALLRRRETLCVAQHGPDVRLARDLVDIVTRWDTAGRPGRGEICVLAAPAQARLQPENGATFVVRRPHTTFFVSMK